MVTKPTSARKCIKVSYIVYIVCLIHVLATRMAILRETHDKGYITNFSEPLYTDITYCDMLCM
jgi:hypothetical protein